MWVRERHSPFLERMSLSPSPSPRLPSPSPFHSPSSLFLQHISDTRTASSLRGRALVDQLVAVHGKVLYPLLTPPRPASPRHTPYSSQASFAPPSANGQPPPSNTGAGEREATQAGAAPRLGDASPPNKPFPREEREGEWGSWVGFWGGNIPRMRCAEDGEDKK